jgi:hypothetical protein
MIEVDGMTDENDKGPNSNTAYVWIAIAGAAGSAAVVTLGGQYNVGWALTAMVSAPAIMAIGIALILSRTR